MPHLAEGGAGDRRKFVSEFEATFSADRERLSGFVKDSLGSSKASHLEFEFVFLPFDSVQRFRDAFVKELTGVADEQIDLRKQVAKLESELRRLRSKAAPKS